MSSEKKKHDFHLVDPSPWPIYVSFATLVLAVGAVYYFHSKALWLLLVGFALVVYGAFMWWRDVIEEAEHQGQTVRVQFDKVLLAIGRQANVEGFGLEELEIPLTQNGTIEVNEAMQTAYPNIYACGDVVGPFQFTHMASFQAYFSSINAMLSGLWRLKAKYNAVPWAIFTHPEVARVGINEEEAKAKNVNYEVTRYDLDQLDRALADREAHGFIIVLTAPGKDKILGVTIVGYHAGELISEFVFAMTHSMGLKKISAVTHIYPTLLEANKFAANAWRNARLPKKFFPWAEKFFRWLRK